MATYPYILKTGTIKRFLEKIPSVGIPDKVTLRYLYALDFKSNNERPIIPVLKFIKFLDASGSPTELYKKFRDRGQSSSVLRKAIKEAYSEVFKIYPDAYKKGNQTLQNFFSTQIGLGERAIKSIVETFKALCAQAGFEEAKAALEDLQEPTEVNTNEDIGQDESKGAKATSHNVDFVLSEGRKVKIVMPQDITKEEIEKLKRLLEAFK